MEYRGSHQLFDVSKVVTYPLKVRPCKVQIEDFVDVAALRAGEISFPTDPWFRDGRPGGGADQSAGLTELARHIVQCRREGRGVIVITGAHPIKTGLGPIFIDLIERDLVTLFSANVAAAIHSFELALTGASSESVRDALPGGEFGMAFETGAYLNQAVRIGAERGLGFGEAVGRLFREADFRAAVIDRTFAEHADSGEYLKPHDGFPHVDTCVFAAAHDKGIPACIHASVGTDITDQHAGFDAAAKGAASGADFLIFAEHIRRFAAGGVVLNVGSAIMGPEVLLKAVSMAANVGAPPAGLWTADFDVRAFVFDDDARDESQAYYYLRDQKSVATRIPKVFGGTGLYFQGLHQQTLPPLYQLIIRELEAD